MQVAAIRCRFMHMPWWKPLFQHFVLSVRCCHGMACDINRHYVFCHMAHWHTSRPVVMIVLISEPNLGSEHDSFCADGCRASRVESRMSCFQPRMSLRSGSRSSVMWIHFSDSSLPLGRLLMLADSLHSASHHGVALLCLISL